MESTKIITKLDFKTLKYCNLFIMKYRRKTHFIYIILSVLSLGVIAADIFHFKSIYLSVLSGLYIAYLVYQIFTVEAKLDQNLTRFFLNRPITTQILEINEDKITLHREQSAEEPIDFEWSFITEILEMPQYYMLMAGKTPIIVDRSEEAVLEGTQANLTMIIDEKAQSKPHKKIDFDIVKRPITFVHPEFPPEDVVEVENVPVEELMQEEIVKDNDNQEIINEEKENGDGTEE